MKIIVFNTIWRRMEIGKLNSVCDIYFECKPNCGYYFSQQLHFKRHFDTTIKLLEKWLQPNNFGFTPKEILKLIKYVPTYQMVCLNWNLFSIHEIAYGIESIIKALMSLAYFRMRLRLNTANQNNSLSIPNQMSIITTNE